jgi:hypothetical protein
VAAPDYLAHLCPGALARPAGGRLEREQRDVIAFLWENRALKAQLAGRRLQFAKVSPEFLDTMPFRGRLVVDRIVGMRPRHHTPAVGLPAPAATLKNRQNIQLPDLTK